MAMCFTCWISILALRNRLPELLYDFSTRVAPQEAVASLTSKISTETGKRQRQAG